MARVLTRQRRQALWAYSFISIPMLGLITFVAYPMVAALWISFQDWNFLDKVHSFVGLKNYLEVFQDKVALLSFVNTLYYTIVVVPVSMVLGLLLALVMNQQFMRFRAFFRTAYYLPTITSWIAVSFVWVYLYEPNFGLINTFLRFFIESPPKWLGSTAWALPAVMITAIWKGLGYNMVLFLAGLQGIPQEYYDAAQMDGAGAWSCFRHITLPLLNPTVTFVAVISAIGSLQVFTPIVVMTSAGGYEAGGPLNSTRVAVYHIYFTAFRSAEMGYAVAMAYLLFFFILGLTILQLRLIQREIQY